MRIQITAVEQWGSLTWVAFTAVVGEGCGRWVAPNAPAPGDEHHVELEFPEPVREFRVLHPGSTPALARDGDVVTVIAQVVDADDSVATLSLGGDVILLELEALAGDCVTFTTRTIDLYPYVL